MKLFKKIKVDLLPNQLNISQMPLMHEAKLIYVRGSSALSHDRVIDTHSKDDNYYASVIKLNGVPLLKCKDTGSPTSESLLATGYGINNAACHQLRTVADALNAPYADLETSIHHLKPLLGLLKTGLYVIADTLLIPTNGERKFFWDVSNHFSAYAATARQLLIDFDYRTINSQPLYLYPSQHTSAYSEQRLNTYLDMLSMGDEYPRAIAYNFSEHMSLLLDGHHKASAAAVSGKMVNTLVIIPYSYAYKDANTNESGLVFSGIHIKNSEIDKDYYKIHINQSKASHTQAEVNLKDGWICQKKWEDKFRSVATNYPSVYEYSLMMSSDASFNAATIEDDFHSYLSHPSIDNQFNCLSIVCWMKWNMPALHKKYAIKLLDVLTDDYIKLLIFKLLYQIKHDEEVEDLFVDYLVESEDKYDPITKLINHYWDDV